MDDKFETLTGFKARVFQHECHHLIGKTMMNFQLSKGQFEYIGKKEHGKSILKEMNGAKHQINEFFRKNPTAKQMLIKEVDIERDKDNYDGDEMRRRNHLFHEEENFLNTLSLAYKKDEENSDLENLEGEKSGNKMESNDPNFINMSEDEED